MLTLLLPSLGGSCQRVCHLSRAVSFVLECSLNVSSSIAPSFSVPVGITILRKSFPSTRTRPR